MSYTEGSEKEMGLLPKSERKGTYVTENGVSIARGKFYKEEGSDIIKEGKKVESHGEETQEQLWNEMLDYCQTHYINDVRVREYLEKRFTITRKS